MVFSETKSKIGFSFYYFTYILDDDKKLFATIVMIIYYP